MRTHIFLGIAASVLIASTSLGQTPPMTPRLPQNASCKDFRQNPDGSWTVLRPSAISGVQVSPGHVLVVNAYYGGLDLAARLNERCR
jgi:hypothetical protein